MSSGIYNALVLMVHGQPITLIGIVALMIKHMVDAICRKICIEWFTG
jgi:hypothetical protein